MQSELTDDTRMVVKEADVAAKVVGGEAIIINLASGLYYSTDKVGGLIWSMVAQGASVGRIAEALAVGYGVSTERARADVRALVRQLLDEDLVSVSLEPSGAETVLVAMAAQPEPYEAPKLTRFDDMADMFALDPPLPELGAVPRVGS